MSSGSVMVPAAWFPEIAAAPNLSDLDLGIHLTLTSESAAFRWRPISTASRASGLIDGDGYMWSTVPPLREHAHPEAVEGEMRAQIDRALAAGIDVTHLDHHMGAALAPEFVDATVRIAMEYLLPVAFPSNIEGFLGSAGRRCRGRVSQRDGRDEPCRTRRRPANGPEISQSVAPF